VYAEDVRIHAVRGRRTLRDPVRVDLRTRRVRVAIAVKVDRDDKCTC
jgi:hypothetical protein